MFSDLELNVELLFYNPLGFGLKFVMLFHKIYSSDKIL